MTTTTKEKKKTFKVSNDPVADFLTRIRNAVQIKSATVLIPYSGLKKNLADLLMSEGYINSVKIIDDETPSTKAIEIELRYVNDVAAIQGLRKISKPGLRKYVKAQYAPKVLNGLGISILSTNQGLKTDRKARKEKVGGELLCQVW